MEFLILDSKELKYEILLMKVLKISLLNILSRKLSVTWLKNSSAQNFQNEL